MNNLSLIIFSVGIVLFQSGCATLFQPGPDRININSKPDGAKIYLDDEVVGHTPAVITVPRASEARFKVEKEGFQPITVDRDKVVSGWFFGNILLGGVIGMCVDLIGHNQGHYSSDPIFIELEPNNRKK